jgi:hypothetical protein
MLEKKPFSTYIVQNVPIKKFQFSPLNLLVHVPFSFLFLHFIYETSFIFYFSPLLFMKLERKSLKKMREKAHM